MSRKNTICIFIFIYCVTIAFMLKSMVGVGINGDNLTAACLGSSLPAMEVTSRTDGDDEKKEEKIAQASTTKVTEKPEMTTVKKKSGDPKVLIVHTHATESYLPSSAGNYHRTAEKNTVRDAGNVLADALEAEGIGVVHDKTLHDNPSYDSSYSRSFETIKALLKKYPSVECVVDLHRDATPAKVAGPVMTVNGKKRAVYSYVISNTTPTYNGNKAFLNKLNGIANSGFDGYTGEILERPYWYNQELAVKSILIEMGNNRNNIVDVRRCAESFGKILAKAL